MIILSEQERKAHIDIIRNNTDSPIAVPPGKRYLIVHIADKTVKSKSGLYIPPSADTETKIHYRQFPPGIGLVVAISGDPLVSEEHITLLEDQSKPGTYTSAGNIDQIEVGDYIRFDPSGAFEFTDQASGMKMLLLYQVDLLSIITVQRIDNDETDEANEPVDNNYGDFIS